MFKANYKPGSTDQITIRHEYHEHEGRRWPLLLWLALAALIFSVILVFGGRWAYRSITQPSKPAIKTVPADSNKLPKVPPASGINGSSTKTGRDSQSPPPSQPLPNTGG